MSECEFCNQTSAYFYDLHKDLSEYRGTVWTQSQTIKRLEEELEREKQKVDALEDQLRAADLGEEG